MKSIIQNKILLGQKLSQRERSLYLLFLATDEEVKSFLKLEKGEWNETSRAINKAWNDI